jgi:hypothetical protein
VLLLVPLKRIRACKKLDPRYHIIDTSDAFELADNKVNITTYAKANAYYQANKTVLKDMVIICDEANYLPQLRAFDEFYDLIRGIYKARNIQLIFMTAYYDDFVLRYIKGGTKPLCIRIDVKDKGYEHVTTYITTRNVFKNIESVTNIDTLTEGNINRLIAFTNQHGDLELLLRTYPDTIFQVVCGPIFYKHTKNYPNVKYISDCKQLNPNIPIVFTSTLECGADIWLDDKLERENADKILIVNPKEVRSNKNICQVIGRVRDKHLLQAVYVCRFNGKSEATSLDYNDAKKTNFVVNEDYSLLLHGKKAKVVQFGDNDKKFDNERCSLYFSLSSDNYRYYQYFDYNKKGVVMSRSVYNYVKWLTLRRMYPEDENGMWRPDVEKYLQTNLWRDIEVNINYFGLLNKIEILLNRIVWTKIKDVDYKSDYLDLERNTQLYLQLKCLIDCVVLLNGGKIQSIYREVRSYNSFCMIPKRLRLAIEKMLGLYEYDTKTANPFFLSLILHQHKDLFDKPNYDFYNTVLPNFSEGSTRSKIKTIVNTRFNSLYMLDGDKFNSAVKKLIKQCGFDSAVYARLASMCRGKGNFYRTLASIEDSIMSGNNALISQLYRRHPSINIVRLHDGIITTEPIYDYDVYVNDYKLTLCSEQGVFKDYCPDVSELSDLPYFGAELPDDGRPVTNEPRKPMIDITLDYWNLYKDGLEFESMQFFNQKTYTDYVQKQHDKTAEHAACGAMNTVHYKDAEGNVLSRSELAAKHGFNERDKNFSRLATKAGYTCVKC